MPIDAGSAPRGDEPPGFPAPEAVAATPQDGAPPLGAAPLPDVPREITALADAGSLAVVTNAAHDVVTCTPALAELLGVKPEELHGTGLAALTLGLNLGKAANGAQTGQVRLRCRVGPPITLDFSVSPLRSRSEEAMDRTHPTASARGLPGGDECSRLTWVGASPAPRRRQA